MIERRDEPLARLLVADRVIDRIEREEGVARKYICVTSRSVKSRPNSEKWMWSGRQAFDGSATGTRPADGDEPVSALLVRQRAARAGKIRISGAAWLSTPWA